MPLIRPLLDIVTPLYGTSYSGVSEGGSGSVPNTWNTNSKQYSGVKDSEINTPETRQSSGGNSGVHGALNNVEKQGPSNGSKVEGTDTKERPSNNGNTGRYVLENKSNDYTGNKDFEETRQVNGGDSGTHAALNNLEKSSGNHETKSQSSINTSCSVVRREPSTGDSFPPIYNEGNPPKHDPPKETGSVPIDTLPKAAKPEQPKSDQPKPEPPKPEQPKLEQPQPEQPKAEHPKPEQPKPEQPKPEQPSNPDDENKPPEGSIANNPDKSNDQGSGGASGSDNSRNTNQGAEGAPGYEGVYSTDTLSDTPVNESIENITTLIGLGSQVIPYFGDYISLGASLVNFGVNPSVDSTIDVGLDAIGAIAPVVPGMGSIRRAARIGEAAKALEKSAGTANKVVDAINNIEKGVEATKKGPVIFRFGEKEVELSKKHWDDMAKEKPENAWIYKKYKERLDQRARIEPRLTGVKVQGKQSEGEVQNIYKQIGGGDEKVYSHGHEGKKGDRRKGNTTKPDFTTSNVMGEVKNFTFDFTDSTKIDENLAKAAKQISERLNIHGPVNIKQQTLVLDIRGQFGNSPKITKDGVHHAGKEIPDEMLQKIGEYVAERTNLPVENIQIVVWGF